MSGEMVRRSYNMKGIHGYKLKKKPMGIYISPTGSMLMYIVYIYIYTFTVYIKYVVLYPEISQNIHTFHKSSLQQADVQNLVPLWSHGLWGRYSGIY